MVTKRILKLYAMSGAGLGTSDTNHLEMSLALDSGPREHCRRGGRKNIELTGEGGCRMLASRHEVTLANIALQQPSLPAQDLHQSKPASCSMDRGEAPQPHSMADKRLALEGCRGSPSSLWI